jgi:hypothetical protein
VLQARTELQHLAAPNSAPGQPGDAGSVPAPAARTRLGRLRLALNRVLTESIPLPNTRADVHGNGQAEQLTPATADEDASANPTLPAVRDASPHGFHCSCAPASRPPRNVEGQARQTTRQDCGAS